MGAPRSLPSVAAVLAVLVLTASGGTGMAMAVRGDVRPPAGTVVERVRAAVPEPTREPKPEARKLLPPRRPTTVAATAAPTPLPSTPAPRPVGTPAPPPPPPPPVVRSSGGPANYTALLIGLDKPEGSEKLTGSVEDVRTMRALLLSAGFKSENITVLVDGHATHDAILRGLDRLVSRTSGKGLAVFLVASHSGMNGGDMTFASGGGGRVARRDVASRLAKVRGKVWSTFATCYAASYNVPGISGKNRIATFSSAKDELSYQIPGAGSVLVVNMVQRAMREEGIRSVEDAFAWAKAHVGSTTGASISMKDDIAGDVIVRAR